MADPNGEAREGVPAAGEEAGSNHQSLTRAAEGIEPMGHVGRPPILSGSDQSKKPEPFLLEPVRAVLRGFSRGPQATPGHGCLCQLRRNQTSNPKIYCISHY